MTPQPVESLLAGLLGGLRAAPLEVPLEDLADALWLARLLEPPKRAAPAGADPAPTPPPPRPPPPSSSPVSGPAGAKDGRAAPVFSPRRGAGAARPAVALRLPPGGRPFRAGPLLQALRPLRLTAPSRIDFDVDEEATAELWGENRARPVVLRPRLLKARQLILLVDQSVSMRVWEEVTDRWGRVLAGSGIFRGVRLLRLNADGDRAVVSNRSAGGTPAGGKARPSRRSAGGAGGAGGRPPGGPSDVVLTLTDACSRAWWTGDALRRLGEWSRHTAVGLVVLLPEELWSRTALGRYASVRLYRPAGGGPLYTLALPGGPDDGPVVPVTSADERAFARTVLLLGNNPRPAEGGGLVAPAQSEPGAADAPPGGLPSDTAPQTAEARVGQFLSSASTGAVRLARLAALFPSPTVKTLRLIRAAADLAATAVQDAEVVLGGLMRAQLAPDGDPDSWVYRFHPGVDEVLRRGIEPESSEARRFRTRFGAYLRRRKGELQGIAAAIPLPAADPALPTALPAALRAGGDEFLSLDKDALAAVFEGSQGLEELLSDLRQVRDWLAGAAPGAPAVAHDRPDVGPAPPGQGTAAPPLPDPSGPDRPREMPEGAVYLSYAGEDLEFARRIREGLEGAGVDVWLDDNLAEIAENWDLRIRRNIRRCSLFVPIISDNTQARLEGLFRLEWRLAEERAMRFHESVAFVVPVAIDRAVPRTAAVPEGFRLIHWAHLPGGRVTPEFTARVLQLWRGHRERREPAGGGGGGGGGRRTFRVYLSAVSSEFGAARSKVAADLQHRGLLVHSAENFGAGPGTVLHRIHDYVRDCSAVICILGQRAGAIPEPAEVEPFRAMLPATSGEASYAQWELLFARYFHKALYVYMAGPGYVPDAAAPAQDGPDELQAKFINYVKQLGLSRSTFSTADELRILVLRQDWPRVDPAAPEAAKPNSLPYPSLGTLFKGRRKFLGNLRRSLQRTSERLPAAAVARALCGPAGTGKTRLAVEYAWRYAHDYTALLFVPAKTPEELREHLFGRQGATLLDLPEREADDEKVKADAVLKWLARRPGWLLILDDVDTPEAAGAVMQLLARLQGGHVILTSRLSDWRAPVKPMELGGLARKDAARFLLRRTRNRRREQPSDAADAEALARQLDGLPLAMDLAAAAIARKRLTIAAYLSALREPVSEAPGRGGAKPAPPAPTDWDTSIQHLGFGETALLRLLCWFGHEQIPQFVLEGAAAETIWKEALARLEAASPAPPRPSHHVGLLDSAARLTRGHFVELIVAEQGGQFVRVHPQVLSTVPYRLPAEQRAGWLALSLRLLDSARPAEPPVDVRTWPRWTLLRPHVTSAVTHADEVGVDHPTARLVGELALFLSAEGRYAEAEPLMRRAIAINERRLGPGHPDVAADLRNLAALLRAAGRLAEAEPLLRRALAIGEVAFGPRHPAVVKGASDSAELLRDMRRPPGVKSEAGPGTAIALRRLPVYLVLDCSGSMHGEPIEAVRLGLRQLLGDLKSDPALSQNVYVSVITFGDEAEQVCPLTGLGDFREPTLEANGTTSLGAALALLEQAIRREVHRGTPDLKGDRKPFVLLMTDGMPTDHWQPAAERLKRDRPGDVIAVAAGDGADPAVLHEITDNVLKFDHLTPEMIGAFFRWASTSIGAAGKGEGRVEAGGLRGLPPTPPQIQIVP